jgi:hypothetical protein
MARVNKRRSSLSSPDYHAPRTVEDVTERNVQTILELEEAAKANRCDANRVADIISPLNSPKPQISLLYQDVENAGANRGESRSESRD